MSVQKLRIKKGFSYTTISNEVVQNLNNYSALGLYTYLLSLPEDWVFYKKQLADHAGIGRDNLDNLLKILVAHNLIEFAQSRAHSGRFLFNELRVKNGTDFKINNLPTKCAPRTEKPLTVNQLLVSNNYIRNKYKRNINTKEISKNICASQSDARKSFEKFWDIYPRKKDKQRAWKIWCQTKCHQKAEIILKKLYEQMLNDVEWKTLQYIPYPTTYLRNARWEDEITLERINTKKEHPITTTLREMQENPWELEVFKKMMN